MAGPLAGLKVIEMVGIGPCPFAAMMLADMGADVIRIDRKPDPDAPNPYPMLGTKFDVMARGRRSLALDLKDPRARQLLLDLVAKADVLVEGFRPGVMERLGLGPEPCLATNPKLVYGRMTGWGQTGPLAHAAGHDANYIALTGALHAIGSKEAPPSIPLNLVGDFGGGGMYLAFGIVCALLEARQSGHGQVVDAAMVDGAASLMTYMYALQAAGRWRADRGENILDGAAPWYHIYETADGKYVSVAAAEPQFYAELLRRLGLAEEELPGQHDRAGWPRLEQRFAAVFRSRTRAQWCEVLEGSDACFAPVLSLAEAPDHSHLKARGTFVEVDGVVQPAPAPRFSRTPADRPRAWVPAGVDDEAALAGWGLDAQDCERRRAAGAFQVG
jgi:alpha-methylacyl-CoA racemase